MIENLFEWQATVFKNKKLYLHDSHNFFGRTSGIAPGTPYFLFVCELYNDT